MIEITNGFACLGRMEVPLAQRGINPADPHARVLPTRSPAGPLLPAPQLVRPTQLVDLRA